MSAEPHADGSGEPTNKQAAYVQQIDEIVVDPEDIIKHYTKNLQNKNTLYDSRSFKLSGFKNDGVAEVSIGVDPRDDGGYYPDQPHPIWLSPGRFVQGGAFNESEGYHQDIGVPNQSENRRLVRESVDVEEGTEEFEEQLEAAINTWEELWVHELRKDLKDEIEFVFGRDVPEMETIRHTVSVRYEESS